MALLKQRMFWGLILAPGLLSGCGAYYTARYRDAVAENRATLLELELGMDSRTAMRAMGEGELVRYRKMSLIDPWKSEQFDLLEGTRVQILYYVTEQLRSARTGVVFDQDLTPLAFENDKLMGWGWSYLRNQTSRYGLSTHKEQD